MNDKRKQYEVTEADGNVVDVYLTREAAEDALRLDGYAPYDDPHASHETTARFWRWRNEKMGAYVLLYELEADEEPLTPNPNVN